MENAVFLVCHQYSKKFQCAISHSVLIFFLFCKKKNQNTMRGGIRRSTVMAIACHCAAYSAAVFIFMYLRLIVNLTEDTNCTNVKISGYDKIKS